MIFLHSSFRTGSTFLWSRLRSLEGATAYYEVYNEFLADCSARAIETTTTESWHSRHPEGRPYFLEFAPLLANDRGIAGFDRRFSTANAIPQGGCRADLPPDEAQYIDRLVSFARAQGKLPVLTCTRSVGRIAGLKRAAPGLHLLLHRNLFRQWCSYSQLHHRGNSFFLDRTADIVRHGAHDPVLRCLGARTLDTTPSPRDPKTFLMFALLHLHLYAQSAGAADATIDLERLEHDRAHRRETEALLRAHGAPVSLKGARNTIAYCLLPPGVSGTLVTELREAATPIIAAAPDAAGRRLATACLEGLVEEYERHEFQTGALRRVVLGDRALATHIELRASLDATRRERDALRLRVMELAARTPRARLGRLVRRVSPRAAARLRSWITGRRATA